MSTDTPANTLSQTSFRVIDDAKREVNDPEVKTAILVAIDALEKVEVLATISRAERDIVLQKNSIERSRETIRVMREMLNEQADPSVATSPSTDASETDSPD